MSRSVLIKSPIAELHVLRANDMLRCRCMWQVAVHERFLRDELDVVVATVAFGMGACVLNRKA